MQQHIPLKQTLMPSLKHPNCGKISGFNGTSLTLSSLLLETFMAVYGRLDYRNSSYGLRIPELSDDEEYVKYSFLLPRGAKIHSVKTFGYTPVMLTEGQAANTFVVSQHGDGNPYYTGHGVDQDLNGMVGDEVTAYYVKMSRKIYEENDFFPYLIGWKDSDKEDAAEYNSCLCFYNLKTEQQNMSDFAAKYLSYLAQECIGCYRVVSPATTSYKDGHFNVTNPVLQEYEYKTARSTVVYDRSNDSEGDSYVFKKLDHLMLPSVRFVGDKLHVMSMNDFDTLTSFTKHLSASLRHFIKMLDEEAKFNQLRTSRSTTHLIGLSNLFGTGNELYTIDYQEGMEDTPMNKQLDTPKTNLIMVGSKVKGNRDYAIDNEIYVYCVSPTFNRMIFGPVPIWHSRPNTSQQKHSSYGNGCLSKHFIEEVYAEIDTFWEELTHSDFKDSVFSSIVGFTSNEIDDLLFADSRLLRSKAANNSTYTDALIYHYDYNNHMTQTVRDEIRMKTAKVYEKVFRKFIEFLHSMIGYNQFSIPLDLQSSNNNYSAFVRINQAPHKIMSRVLNVTSRTALGIESHDEHTVKLSYMIVTGQHSNTNFYMLAGENGNRVKTHNRADGGIFMAIENVGHTISEDDAAVLSSPFGKPARDAYLVSKMVGNHIDFFIPSVITSKRVSAVKYVPPQRQPNPGDRSVMPGQNLRSINILEISHRYPEKIVGAQINPTYYEQRRIGMSTFAANSEVFSAIPPPSYDEQSVAVSGQSKETFKASDILTIKRDWITYVCGKEFIKNIINRTGSVSSIDYSFSASYLIACLIADNTKILDKNGKIIAEPELNIFEFMSFHEKEIGKQELDVGRKTFEALKAIANEYGVSEQWKTISDDVANSSDPEQTIKQKLTMEILASFYQMIFPDLYVNFYKNARKIHRIHRLNVITEAVRMYHIKKGVFDTKVFSHQKLINAALLVSGYGNERSDRVSYYSKEQYMGMSASVYLSENPKLNKEITLNDIYEEIQKNTLNYSRMAKKLAANPVFANIADVPMMRSADKTYIHLLNDMCSVNSNNMYYFIKCLSNASGDNYRFDFITGFVKRRAELSIQQRSVGTQEFMEGQSLSTYVDVINVIKRKGEEYSFDDLPTFMRSVYGAIANADRGKHRAATDFVLARFSHNRSFMNSILPSHEARYQNATDNKIENIHADFRTFYQRGGHMTKDDIVQREKGLIDAFLIGSA